MRNFTECIGGRGNRITGSGDFALNMVPILGPCDFVILFTHEIQHALGFGDRAGAHYLKVLAENRFKRSLVVLIENVASGRQKSAHLGIGFWHEFDNQGATYSAEEVGDHAERNIVGYCQMVN